MRGLVLALFAWTLTMGAAPAWAVKSEAIIVDARSGEVLYQENADAVTFPASLTKMMTLYLTFEALDDERFSLDQPLPVSTYAESMAATKLGVRAGSTLRVEQAILGLVTKSANDAAVVLAEAIAGTEAQFAEMMTQRAQRMGMRSTTFRNASGLPNDEQVTTARDLSILARGLIQDFPKYYPYFSRRNFVYGGHSLPNHNHLMSRYDGMDGIKTGYIRASGFNLAASAVRDGRRLVAVVLGGTSAVSRDNRMAVLLDQTFARLRGGHDTTQPIVAKGDSAPAARPAAGRATPASNGGNDEAWGVQLGAFTSRALGQQALAKMSKAIPSLLGDAKASVVEVATRQGKVFRARLMGLDEKSARDACTRLQRSGQHCVPVQDRL
jgi:D-alanyl-D-alanine carboxypeptidase